MAGVEPGSQEAYELAVKGFLRVTEKSVPVLYGIKCIDFNPPEFVIEVQCVNEYEMYLQLLIHELGLKLHSNAVCIGIQCIRHSYFSLNNALLRKHWTLQHVLDNLLSNKTVIDSHIKSDNLIEMAKHG